MANFESVAAAETAGGGQLRRALRVRHLVMLAVGGTIASGFLLFAGSAIGIAGPAVIVSYVIAGFGFLFAWLMIALSQPLYRLKMGAEWVRNLKWKTPLYPLTPIIAVVTVLGALIGQFFTGGSGQKLGPLTIPGGGLAVVVGVIWTVIWGAYYMFFARHKFTHGDTWRSQEDEVAGQTAMEPEPLPPGPVADAPG